MLPKIISKGFIYQFNDCEIHFTFDLSNNCYALIKNQSFYHGKIYTVGEVNSEDLMKKSCIELYNELQNQILIHQKSSLL